MSTTSTVALLMPTCLQPTFFFSGNGIRVQWKMKHK